MASFQSVKGELAKRFARMLDSSVRTQAGVKAVRGAFEEILDKLRLEGSIDDFQVIMRCNPVYDALTTECASYQEYILRAEARRMRRLSRCEQDFAVRRDASLNEPYFALFRIAIKPGKSINYIVWELRRD